MSAITRIVVTTSVIAIVAAIWAFTSSLRRQQPAPNPATLENSQNSGSEIVDGYKQWTRVNPVPAILHSQIAVLCAPVTTAQSRLEENNPHRDKFITVYVNHIGRHAMMQEKTPTFPLGSVIVKEKLTRRDSTSPELLTVMIKREPGYNPDNGDWEYMVLDGPGKSVQARGKLDDCQGCHMLVKSTDYVSRNYLPSAVRQRLK